MRNLTEEEIGKVSGGIAPAIVGAMYIATHPATITAVKWGGGAFALGFMTHAGGRFYDYMHSLMMK
ncbi:MAG: hypothetical protein JJU22_03315 [Gammaproteobacteria bacterium]|nr:hypothetical protein [Gammaproteobacteria bacterium]